MTTGGLDHSIMPDVVDALGTLDVVTTLDRNAGPLSLVNGGLDPFRADESQFLAACRDGRRRCGQGAITSRC